MINSFTAEDLRIAILTNQLFVMMQPKVYFKNFQCIGYEVLLRWHHPTHGLIRADQWIQVAEERGLISQLTYWLIEQVASHWASLPFMLPVAINVSPSSLSIPFATQVLAILRRYQVPTHLVTIELTEGRRVEDYTTVARSLNVLRNQGIRISLDDFGTGYNSMKTLLELQVDEVKIDQSFIRSKNPASLFVLSSLAKLAKDLGLTIVCEGIETQDHLNRARKIGADVGQGYLFSKPEVMEQNISHHNENRKVA
jgi:EAL domain-containing protein (putative c-di-GMP-specific phosphodiesterase class I)